MFYGRGYGALFEGFDSCESDGRQVHNISICLTLPLYHVIDRLHTTVLYPWRQLPCPPGLSLRTYNILYGYGFGLPQAIRAVQIGNYDVILMIETNIPDAVYCHNCVGYNIV